MNNAGNIDEKSGKSNYIIYKENYESCQKKLNSLILVSDRVSLLRIITFAISGLLLFLGYQQKDFVFFVPAFVVGLAFLMLIRYHCRLEEEQACLKDSQSVIKDYIGRFDDSWKSFPVDGARYLSDDLLEARDLDLFGKSSLYQYICTASTVCGQDQLARWLSLPYKGLEKSSVLQVSGEMKSRQQAVAELAEKTEFYMEFETGARRLRDMEYDRSKEVLDNFFYALEIRNNFPMACRIMLRVFPILTLTLLFSALFGIQRHLTIPLFFLFSFAQLMSVFLGFYRSNKALSPVCQMNRAVTPYRKLFQLLEEASFESIYLQDLQKSLLKNGTASAALKELEEIADSVCIRNNIFAFLLYNSLFLHDYYCIEKYGKWKDNYRDSLNFWLEALGKVEALISLSVISHTRKSHCLPEIVDSKRPMVTASNIRHPLLQEQSAVGNDMDLTHRACIITGSNMSGKTTFMRSIGINLALAYAGGFCTASNLRVSLMELCTSIRTEDNVNEGISTFYAELLRIKQMIQVSRRQVPMISLIDEIYKGTNSKDRIFAAKETIRNLSNPYALILVTTHDFELCDLENDSEMDAKNYYFTEYYKENKILFDYKLREGRCNTTNARYLLRMAGILK